MGGSLVAIYIALPIAVRGEYTAQCICVSSRSVSRNVAAQTFLSRRTIVL